MRFKILENILLEGIQKDFKDRHGEELFNLFMSVRNKLDKPYNDMSYWMKKSTEELQDFLNNTEIKKSNRETAKEDKSGAKLVAQDGNIKLYFITTYDAMKYYGKGTKWCIAGNYPGHEGRGQEYFDNYIKDYNLDGGYYVITDGKDKYCILTSKGEIQSVWNTKDDLINVTRLPDDFIDVLKKYGRIKFDANVFKIDENGILRGYIGKDLDVVIPDTVVEIGPDSFDGSSIESVVIPSSVKTIGDFAFSDCRYLMEVTIPDTVEVIEPYAFIGCSSLKEIVVPGSVKTVSEGCFDRCGLREVILSEGVTAIGDFAFANCRYLDEVKLPSSLVSIGKNIFEGGGAWNVYYNGSLEDLKKVSIDRSNKQAFSHIRFSFNESYNKNGVKMKFRLIERVLNEDIESMKKYFPNIPDEQFQSLIELDPTYKPGSKNAGNYGRWILTLANKGKLDNLGHVKDLLTRFNDESKYLKNKDIMRYKTMDEVEDMLNDDDSYKEQSHRQEVRDRQKARKNADLGNEAKKVYEDSDWEVWVPLTYAASCKLGQGASWCTASTESDYYYNHYKNAYGGEYYINISKHNPEEKYQFHFESNQFMDVDDDEIDLENFLTKNTGLKEFYSDIIYNSYVKQWGLEDGVAEIDTDVLADELSTNRTIGEDFLKACFSGDLFEYFMDYGNYTDDNVIEDYYLSETNKENMETIESITGLDVNDRGFLEAVEEEYPDVYEAIRIACSEAEVTGAESECYNDFVNSLNSSLKPFIIDWEYIGNGMMKVTVDLNYMRKYITEVMVAVDDAGDYSDDFSHVVACYMEPEWDFSEPGYGWSGFDADTYNDRLSDELYGLGEQK